MLRALAADVEETCHLCVLRDREVLTLLSVSGHSFRVAEWEGRGVPAACTSAGRVLLQDATPDELYVRFGTADLGPIGQGAGLRPRVNTLPELWSRIQESKRDGYAMVREEFEAGLVGVSAPVRDFRGRVVAALNVSAPKERLDDRLSSTGSPRPAGQRPVPRTTSPPISAGRSTRRRTHRPDPVPQPARPGDRPVSHLYCRLKYATSV